MFAYIRASLVFSGTTKKRITMSYVKISDRNLKKVKVTILSERLKFSKVVREDRVSRFVNDVVFFNKLTGKAYMVNVKQIS